MKINLWIARFTIILFIFEGRFGLEGNDWMFFRTIEIRRFFQMIKIIRFFQAIDVSRFESIVFLSFDSVSKTFIEVLDSR